MHCRPKILLLIPHLGGGGAERVFELLARNLSADKYELHLGLPTEMSSGASELPPTVAVHRLGARRVRGCTVALVRLVRQLRPDLILATMAHLNFMVLALRPLFPRGTRVLVRQNGTVSAMLADLRSPALTRLLYRTLYPCADGVVCQSAPMAEDLCATARVPRERLLVAPNPIEWEAIRRHATTDSCWQNGGPNLLAVGRLVPQKGFDLLLEALSMLRERYPRANLTIAGAGADEPALRSQCAALGLESMVRWLGHVRAPAVHYSGATLFVASSRQEGMPNALLEAAAAGLPIVSTPSSAGLAQLLNTQPGVWLADATTAGALAESLGNAIDSLGMGERFEHAWMRPFRLENAIETYESMIDRMLTTGREIFA